MQRLSPYQQPLSCSQWGVRNACAHTHTHTQYFYFFWYISLEAPSAPDRPEQLSAEGVTSDRLTLRWTGPIDNGGLAIQNYTVVLDNRGSPFCPETNQMMYTGLAAGTRSLDVTDLPAGFQFQFHVIVFTSVFSTTSRTSSTFSTLPAGTVRQDRYSASRHLLLSTS